MITEEILKEIEEKSKKILEIRGINYDNYYFCNVSCENGQINVIYGDQGWGTSDDRYEEIITVEEFNTNIEDLIEKVRKDKEEAIRIAKELEQERIRQGNIEREKRDKREYERLKKIYGNNTPQ